SQAAPAPMPPQATGPSPVGIATLVMLLAVGGGAAWYTLSEAPKQQRAVSGSPGGPETGARGGATPPPNADIVMPAEVATLLAELEAGTEANPEDADAWQKLTRARYRASVLNSTYRAGAAAALKELLALDPSNLEGLRIAGNLAYDDQNFPEAEKHFRAYLDQDAEDAGVYTDLGSALLFQNDLEGAIATYEVAVQKDPAFLQAWFNLGIALQRNGQEEEALAALTKARKAAGAPEQQAFIDNAIAALTGQPSALPSNHPPVGGGGAAAAGAPAAAAAPQAGAASNASTDFQRSAQALLLEHRIVGRKVAAVEWTGPATANIRLDSFPMDKMPPVMLNKFKSGMNESLVALAKTNGITDAIDLALLDNASGDTMDHLDGKEWIGAFDEENYQ
ncbi:MAG: tetratricopeptide (TPR) repeat protein, partial [Candidatus Binatia bacterium]